MEEDPIMKKIAKLSLEQWEEEHPDLVAWKKAMLKKNHLSEEKQKLEAWYPQKFILGTDLASDWTDIGMVEEPQKWVISNPQETTGTHLHQFLTNDTWTTDDVDEYIKAFQDALKSVHDCYGGVVTPTKFHYEPSVWDRMRQQMPELSEEVRCPVEGDDHCVSSVWGMVQHLNDYHSWTREKIADWLEESGNNPEFQVPDDVPKEPGEK